MQADGREVLQVVLSVGRPAGRRAGSVRSAPPLALSRLPAAIVAV